MLKRVQSWGRRLQEFADRPWYFPLLGILAGIDLFVLVIPTDALLVSSVMLQPKRWVTAFLWVAFGSSLGCAIMAGLIQWDSHLVMEVWFPSTFDSAIWHTMDVFFDRHGWVALALIALSPLVQFPAVAIAALAGMPPLEVFVVCLVGRSIKSALIAWVATFAPRMLLRIPGLRHDLETLQDPR